ncbi:hypothetical protein [Paenibacillus lautus]|uniref:hypothetical protein n=1 Tax=Paenibacillus lautus TaxID=1401 RepID=UPI003D2E4434
MSNYACDGQSIPFDAFLRQMLNDPTVAELTDFVASYVKNNTISQTDGFKGDSMKHETEMGGTLSEVLPQLNTGSNMGGLIAVETVGRLLEPGTGGCRLGAGRQPSCSSFH